jgi:hypothetical protein
MTVSFASQDSYSQNETSSPVYGAVLVGEHPTQLDRLVLEDEEGPLFYSSLQPGTHPMYASPFQHHITITGLEPQMRYYFQCLTRPTLEELLELQHEVKAAKHKDEQVAKQILEQEEESEQDEKDAGRRRLKLQWERHLLRRRLAPPPYDSTQCACPDPDRIRSFRTFYRTGHGYPRFAIMGDIGQFPHSEETMDHLRLHHLQDKKIDAIVLAGDLAYSELDHRRWDTFMDFLDDYPLIDQVPLHVTPGNHDIDKPEFGSDIFVSYETRFRMPRIQEAELGVYEGDEGKLNMDRPPYPLNYEYGNAYYAFSYGRTHLIFLNSYSSLEPGSKQYDWFVQELENVNRKNTPWLFVTYHVPIYNTFEVHQKDEQMFRMRANMEPLFVKYKVNLIFNGHIHAYMRTKPVAFGNVTKTGPIHIVMGAGGRNAEAQFLNEEPEDWVVVRDATIYGYGLLEICNDTHARWDWVHTGQNGDHNVVFNENVSLPSGGVDHTYFFNQYFIL